MSHTPIISLSDQEVEKICHRYIHRVDKFPRMFLGISSSLIQYQDQTLYLKVCSSQGKFNNFEHAQKTALNWKNGNPELKDAQFFRVDFYKMTCTGFSIEKPLETTEEKLKALCEMLKNQTEEFDTFYAGMIR